MARTGSWAWTVIISLLVGIAAATIFWLYSPYGHDQLAHQVAADLKTQPIPTQVKPKDLNAQKLPSQATGSRFQMVTDFKEVFVVDLKAGRVWRYYHQTKEAGFNREDEGFLPVPFYFAGKKHYAVSEIELPASDSKDPAGR
jgi:hypothetical protein